MSNKSITASLLWDRLGIGVSGICAIHCLFFPVLISILPLFSFAELLHDWAHPVFVVFLVPIVFFASRRSHFDRTITSLLVTGFLVVLTGWLLGHFWLGILFETSLTLLGSGILIAGHWFNYRHHQTCKNHSHQHHPVADEDS
ncbi:MAG: MerC domain-containing protein [Balneolaceae bacterium]